jgi:hypothetical protein
MSKMLQNATASTIMIANKLIVPLYKSLPKNSFSPNFTTNKIDENTHHQNVKYTYGVNMITPVKDSFSDYRKDITAETINGISVYHSNLLAEVNLADDSQFTQIWYGLRTNKIIINKIYDIFDPESIKDLKLVINDWYLQTALEYNNLEGLKIAKAANVKYLNFGDPNRIHRNRNDLLLSNSIDTANIKLDIFKFLVEELNYKLSNWDLNNIKKNDRKDILDYLQGKKVFTDVYEHVDNHRVYMSKL